MSGAGIKAITHDAGCGYGDAACSYLAALDTLGIPVSWQPVATPEQVGMRQQCLSRVHDGLRATMDRLWRRPISCDTLLLCLPPDTSFEQYLQETAVAKYCCATWELQQLPPHWAPLLNRFDGVIVPSQFNARAFECSGVNVPVTVVPHVTRPRQPTTAPHWQHTLEGLYVFYTIGTWTKRKAMEDTVRAYLEAFTAEDEVCLVVKTEDVNQMSAPPAKGATGQLAYRMVWYALAKILADYSRPARVHLITECLSPAGIDSLHARGDCFLSLTHSEGWGLGAFDALQFANPVIMPGFGGQLDYLGDDYPLLVRHHMEPLAASQSDGYFSGMGDQHWAKACRRHAGELMLQVHADRKWAAALGERMQVKIERQFSAQRVAGQLASALGVA